MTALNDILTTHDRKKFAVTHGIKMHIRLQRVIIDGDRTCGDPELVSLIRQNPSLLQFFAKNSQTEVSIAGVINTRFISRRIDRLIVNQRNKTIAILDYKTDIDCDAFRDKYVAQLREYATLLHAIYPDYKITAHILWTHDFSLENIPIKPL